MLVETKTLPTLQEFKETLEYNIYKLKNANASDFMDTIDNLYDPFIGEIFKDIICYTFRQDTDYPYLQDFTFEDIKYDFENDMELDEQEDIQNEFLEIFEDYKNNYNDRKEQIEIFSKERLKKICEKEMELSELCLSKNIKLCISPISFNDKCENIFYIEVNDFLKWAFKTNKISISVEFCNNHIFTIEIKELGFYIKKINGNMELYELLMSCIKEINASQEFIEIVFSPVI